MTWVLMFMSISLVLDNLGHNINIYVIFFYAMGDDFNGAIVYKKIYPQ